MNQIRSALRVSVSALAVVIAWAGAESIAKEKTEKPAAAQAEVIKVSGAVRVGGQAAKAGMAVRAGARIETDRSDASFVDIRLPNDRTVRLKNGEMLLANLSDQFVLRLDRGKLFAHTDALSKGQTFKIQTPSAVAGIRGTKFFMEAKPDETYICVCEGKVWAKKKGMAGMMGKEIVVSAGEDAHVRPKEKLQPPVESPMMAKMTWDEFKNMGFQSDVKKSR